VEIFADKVAFSTGGASGVGWDRPRSSEGRAKIVIADIRRIISSRR